MDLYEIVDQVAALVQQRGQVTYRSLKRQFALDDDYFEDLKAELLYTHPEVVDDEGRGFKWAGAASVPHATVPVAGAQSPSVPNPQPPAAYTPPHLAERIRAEQRALEARGASEGERKTITALFADLKGSTALIEGLDPEEARALIDPALQLMMDAVHRYEGYVAQALGDGIFALFGAPIAHEDHPQRALYAALRMQEEMRRYADRVRLKQGTALSLHQLAVMGRQFPLSLVRQVVAQPEEALYHLLASLQRKEFLYEQPALPEPDYIFKHALTQEVAYGTVLQERRKALHERTAQAIEALYRATLDDHYSELAHHYTRSGNTEKAVEYLRLAGQQAVQRSAHVEAISHLTTALELLKTLPDTVGRTQQELLLQTTLGPALMATKGFGAPEVEKTYARARDLCQQVGETPQLFWVLGGLWQFYLVRAEYQTARELGEQLLSLAQSVQDPALLLAAHRALGEPLFLLGELALARAHQEQGIALYNLQQHRSLAFLYGLDPGVMCLNFAVLTLWHLGYPDQVLKRSREGTAVKVERWRNVVF